VFLLYDFILSYIKDNLFGVALAISCLYLNYSINVAILQMKALQLFFAPLFFLYFALSSAEATHLVGGVIELQHIKDDRYKVSVKLYFDVINGNPSSLESEIKVSVFTKNDRIFSTYTFPILCKNLYVQNKAIAVLELVYSGGVTAPDNSYVVYERCCRQFSISNIMNPGGTGMVLRTGLSPLNTSPIFKVVTPLNLVSNNIFTFSTGISDPDNDSLRYSFVIPERGHTSSSNVIASLPQPYSKVDYEQNFNVIQPFGRDSYLKINETTGEVTGFSKLTGIFITALQVEEFKNKVKINSTIQDLQFFIFGENLNLTASTGVSCALPITTGIETENFEFITIQNPILEQLTIKTSEDAKNIEMHIFNDLGQAVLRIPPFIPVNGEFTVPFSAYSPGVYLLQIKSGNTILQRKFVKL